MQRAIFATLLALGSAAANAESIVFEQGLNGYTGNLTLAIASAAPNSSFDGTYSGTQDISIDLSTGDYGGAGGISQGLIRFDNIFGVTGIPTNAAITSATLRTFTTSDTGGTISFYRMLKAWDASTSWNVLVDGINVGTDTLATAQDEAPGLASGVFENWDVTASVQAWQAGAPMEGWAILNNSTNGWDFVTEFGSAQFAQADQRPRLTVEFAPAPVPVPAAAWLLGSGLVALARRRKAAR